MLPAQQASSRLAGAAGGGTRADDEDHRILLHGVTWGRYVIIRELLDDIPGLRMTYLEGTLEIMSPSSTHEDVKKLIARLVEIYALERDIDLTGRGSTTYRKEARERGLEPDECYFVGDPDREFPDLAIEVALTSGGIDKLEVYLGLCVSEVWIWRQEALAIYEWAPSGYTLRQRSAVLPELDIELLAECIRMKGRQSAIVRTFRDRLRQR